MSKVKTEQRIIKEIAFLQKDKSPHYYACPKEEGYSIYIWEGYILGPMDTPYEGGRFDLNITFPNNYPFAPPKISFITKIRHCNISSSGDICLDLLSLKWNPILKISDLLLSLCSLLNEPNPDDPYDEDISDLYLNDKEEYDRIIREETMNHAIKE
jgi:ubiquitin-conjugating enzyme E2 D/E